jgi:hypothetical protein
MQYSFAVKIGDGRARRVALVPCICRACSRSVWCDDKECSRPPGFILVAGQCTAYHSRLPCIHSNHSLFTPLSLFYSLSLPSFAFVMNDAVFQLIRILMWSVVYGEFRHPDTIVLTRLTHLRSLCCFIHRRSLPHRPLWITLLRTLHRHRLHALHDHGHYQLVRGLGSTRRADAAWNLG